MTLMNVRGLHLIHLLILLMMLVALFPLDNNSDKSKLSFFPAVVIEHINEQIVNLASFEISFEQKQKNLK